MGSINALGMGVGSEQMRFDNCCEVKNENEKEKENYSSELASTSFFPSLVIHSSSKTLLWAAQVINSCFALTFSIVLAPASTMDFPALLSRSIIVISAILYCFTLLRSYSKGSK